jgi:hypothetical protein
MYLQDLNEQRQEHKVEADRERVDRVEPQEFFQVIAFCLEDEEFVYPEILDDVHDRADDEHDHVIDDMREQEKKNKEGAVAEESVPRAGYQEFDLFFML